MTNSWDAIIGYVAGVLVASSFYMKTIVPLRFFAIASNVCLITYAFLNTPELYPVFFLHLFLLPLNIFRLWEIKKLIKDVRAYSNDGYSLEWLIPYMKKAHYKKDNVLFNKGDLADKMFLIRHGKILLPEINHIVGPGEILGEMGILSPKKRRTGGAVCLEDVDVLYIDETQAITLYYQNPSFGLFLLEAVIKRFNENHERVRKNS